MTDDIEQAVKLIELETDDVLARYAMASVALVAAFKERRKLRAALVWALGEIQVYAPTRDAAQVVLDAGADSLRRIAAIREEFKL
jgi:hypothetical protein